MFGLRLCLPALLVALLAAQAPAAETRVVISVTDQLLALVDEGRASIYKVSTSKFGLGDEWGSYKTPLGRFRVCEKLGDQLPLGAVIKNRAPTGEVLPPNAPGRDPIVTRILWLEGLDPGNSHARERAIYIHGTPEEEHIGQPSSYGCVRMRSRDVAVLFGRCGLGSEVLIGKKHLGELLRTQFGFRLAECPALPGYPPRVPVPIIADHPLLALAKDANPPPWLRLVLCRESLWLNDTSEMRYTALLQLSRAPRRRGLPLQLEPVWWSELEPLGKSL